MDPKYVPVHSSNSLLRSGKRIAAELVGIMPSAWAKLDVFLLPFYPAIFGDTGGRESNSTPVQVKNENEKYNRCSFETAPIFRNTCHILDPSTYSLISYRNIIVNAYTGAWSQLNYRQFSVRNGACKRQTSRTTIYLYYKRSSQLWIFGAEGKLTKSGNSNAVR